MGRRVYVVNRTTSHHNLYPIETTEKIIYREHVKEQIIACFIK